MPAHTLTSSLRQLAGGLGVAATKPLEQLIFLDELPRRCQSKVDKPQLEDREGNGS